MNKVVPKTAVLETAFEWAKEITQNSPDSVQSTKRALVLSNQLGDVEDVVVAHFRSKEMLRVYEGDNIKVSFPMSPSPLLYMLTCIQAGLIAFAEVCPAISWFSAHQILCYAETEADVEEPRQTMITNSPLLCTLLLTSSATQRILYYLACTLINRSNPQKTRY